jgi:type II secretory pathway pseudopilin PulG
MAFVQSFLPAEPICRGAPRRRGLSTVEMMVTMGILAFLIGISVTVFSGTRRARSQALCSANLHSIGIAFSLYSQEYQNSYPIPTPEAQWEDQLRPYTPRATFCCPGDAELFSALSSSYDWRDTGNPNTTLAGRTTLQVSHSDVALAFDALPDWHQKSSIQVLRANESVELMSVPSFFLDIQRSPIDP